MWMFRVFCKPNFSRARVIKSFARDRSGTVATTFALAAIPVLAIIGAGVDYGQGNDDKARLQAAVDEGVLAAMQAPNGSSTAVQQAIATAAFDASLAGRNDFILASTDSATKNTTPTFIVNSDGSVSGSATANIKASVLGTTLALSVTAKAIPAATQAPSNVTFTLTGGYGWYWKQVDLYIHQQGASSDTHLASYVYQPNNLTYGSGRGTGPVTAYFPDANGVMQLSSFVNQAVSLGNTYDNAYLTMTVYTDGCGAGMAPNSSQSGSNSNYTCVASGTKSGNTTYTKTANPVTYSTMDASTSNHLFLDGVDLPLGKPPTIFQLMACGQTTTHAWEDTPWAGNYGGSWSQQDIFFSVQTTACQLNVNYVTPYLAQ